MELFKYFSREERIKRLTKKLIKLSNHVLLLADDGKGIHIASNGKTINIFAILILFLKNHDLFDSFLEAMNEVAKKA